MKPLHPRAGRSLVRLLFVVVVMVALGGAVLVFDATRPVCPPDVPRPWAAQAFAERTADLPPSPWPTIAEVGPDPGPATISADGTEIQLPPGPRAKAAGEMWQRYRRLRVAPGEVLALPGDGGWSAEIRSWRAPGTPWLDPANGEALDVEPEGPPPIRNDGPTFEAIIEVRPGAGAVGGRARINGALLFDRRTGVKLNEWAGWREPAERGALISISTGLAHRADLMLEVLACYGDAPTTSLGVSDGAEEVTATGLTLRVERVSSGRSKGTSWGDRGGFSVVLDGVDAGAAPTLAVVSIWPRAWADRTLVTADPAAGWSAMIGHNALRAVPWRDRPAPEAIQVRVLPQAVRLQFELAPPLPLPEVEDLFDLPPPGEGIGVITHLEQRLQIDLDPLTTVQRFSLPVAPTSGEVVDMLLAGTDLRFHRPTFTITLGQADIVERIRRWISGLLP